MYSHFSLFKLLDQVKKKSIYRSYINNKLYENCGIIKYNYLINRDRPLLVLNDCIFMKSQVSEKYLICHSCITSDVCV